MDSSGPDEELAEDGTMPKLLTKGSQYSAATRATVSASLRYRRPFSDLREQERGGQVTNGTL